MDLSVITEIKIPEGVVRSIHCESTPLWNRSCLPAGYHLLPFIQSDGRQYIDTGVSAADHSNGIYYEMKGRVLEYAQPNGHNYLFGCLNEGERSCNVSLNTTSDFERTAVYIGANSSPMWTCALPVTGADFSLSIFASSTDIENISAQLNDVNFARFEASAEPCAMPSANIYLLWCNGVGTSSLPFYGRIYSFKMLTADGLTIRNFIPCQKLSDQSLGLFDTVESQFYGNIGTGAFTTETSTL